VFVELAIIAGALGIAYAGARLAVPLVIRLPLHQRLLDYPDGARRKHARPIPRLGGIAIFAGVLSALAAAAALRAATGSAATLPPLTTALVAASAILFLVGLADDLRGIRPLAKLGAQTAAALIVCYAGFSIETLSLPPLREVSLGWLAIPVTVVWMVGISNALNLVDGLDGLAGGVAVIALAASAASALVLGDTTLPWQTAVLIGALLGFLRYNRYPARIFLGDSGSLVVGFLVAVFAVKGGMRSDGTVFALVPLLALSYPLLDTGISIMRRWLRREPLSRADGRHIHHQLLHLGLTPRQAALAIYVQSAVLAALGIVASFARPGATVIVALAGAGLLFAMLTYGAARLQYHEFVVAASSLASAARRARGIIRDKIHARDVMRVMTNAATLAELQAIIADCAGDFRFARMALVRASSADRSDPGSGRQNGPMWKLEYTISYVEEIGPLATNSDPFVLVIWCSRETRRRSAGGERVAEMLVPVIEQWLWDHPLEPAIHVQRELEIVRLAINSPLGERVEETLLNSVN